jgi:hypothetical protein
MKVPPALSEIIVFQGVFLSSGSSQNSKDPLLMNIFSVNTQASEALDD